MSAHALNLARRRLSLIEFEIQELQEENPDADVSQKVQELGLTQLEIRRLERKVEQEKREEQKERIKQAKELIAQEKERRLNTKPSGWNSNHCQCTNGNEHWFCVQNGTCWN